MKSLAVALVLAVAGAPAVADTHVKGTPYAGVAITGAHLSGSAADLGAADFDDKGYGLKLFGGYRFNEFVSIEAAAANGWGMGIDAGTGEKSLRSRDYSIAAVGTYAIDKDWAVLAKLGLAHTRLSSSVADGSDNGVLIGLGANYLLDKQWMVRGEFERLNNYAGTGEALQRANLGVVYTY